VFKPKPLNAFRSVQAILVVTVEEEPLNMYLLEQSTVSSPWNLRLMDAVREGGGLDINDLVFGQHWT